MTGGVMRVLLAGIGHRLIWPIDDRDTTLISLRTARVLAALLLACVLMGALGFVIPLVLR